MASISATNSWGRIHRHRPVQDLDPDPGGRKSLHTVGETEAGQAVLELDQDHIDRTRGGKPQQAVQAIAFRPDSRSATVVATSYPLAEPPGDPSTAPGYAPRPASRTKPGHRQHSVPCRGPLTGARHRYPETRTGAAHWANRDIGTRRPAPSQR